MKIQELVVEANILSKIAGSSGVQKAAAGIGGGKLGATVAQAKQDIGTISQAFGNSAKYLTWLATSLGVGTVLVKTYSHISDLNKQLDAKQISSAEYEDKLEAELAYASSQLAAAGLVKFFVKGGGALIGSIPFLGWAGKLIKAFQGPAAAAFLAWIQTPEGSKVFAQFFVGAMFAEGSWQSKSLGWARDVMGRFSKKAYDTLLMRGDQVEKATGKPQGASSGQPAGEPEDDFVKSIVPTAPAANTQRKIDIDPMSGSWTNKPGS